MSANVQSGPEEVIRRLLLMEHGLRKAARIMLFMNRRQLLPILLALPNPVLAALSREMARLKAQIPDVVAERERLRGELGAGAEAIDLSPPDPHGAKLFAFLEGIDPEALNELSSELDERTLATVICNAPSETAVAMLGKLGGARMRARVIEEMTRLGALGDAPAGDIALEVRHSIGGAYRRLRDKQGVTGTRAIRKGMTAFLDLEKRETRVLTKASRDRDVPPDGALDQSDSTAAPMRMGTRGAAVVAEPEPPVLDADIDGALRFAKPSDIQRALGAVRDDLLAIALRSGDEFLVALVQSNVSRGRLADAMAAVPQETSPTGEEVAAARRRILNAIYSAG